MELQSISEYDDLYTKREEDRRGEFSPFTFLCFSLILFFIGLIFSYSASYNRAITNNLPHYKYFFDQLKGALVGAGCGLVFVFLPEKIIKHSAFLFVPLSLCSSLLDIYHVFDFSDYKAIMGLLSLLAIITLYIFFLDKINKGKKRGFFIASLIIIYFLIILPSSYLNGSGFYLLAMIVSIFILKSNNTRSPLIVFFSIFGIVVFLFFLLLSKFNLLSFLTESNFFSFWSDERELTLFAIFDGGLSGVGLGNGLYKLGLSETHFGSDVFLTVIEESGIFGVLIIILALFIVLIIGTRTIDRAKRNNSQLSSIIVGSFVSIIFFSSILNMLNMVGLNPFSGLPLLFFSLEKGVEAYSVFLCFVLYKYIHKEGRINAKKG